MDGGAARGVSCKILLKKLKITIDKLKFLIKIAISIEL
jgi:hypothetical protein